jgi:FHA domain
VSRRHCSISPQPQGFASSDLGSRNGTLIVALGGPDDDFQSLSFVLRPTTAAPDAPSSRGSSAST